MAEITEWVKKIWKNRITEFPTRRELTKEDGSSEIVTVTRNEGTVSEEGDAFDADTMNNLEERIDAGFADVNRNLVKYNEETDSLDVFFNGEIAGSFPCGFQALDLYNYGDECVDVTGGWTIFNSHVNATFTKTANGMYLKTTGNGVYLNIKTANTIDFSKYSKLCIETSDCKLVRSQPWMLYVKCGGSTYDIVERVSEYRTETIDLPDTMKFAITGNNETNVTITVNNGGAYADSVTEITIHRIYLIK